MRRVIGLFWDTGLRLRCPVCDQGSLFADRFNMHPICPHCSVRFERFEGEVVGGMTISIVVTASIFLGAHLLVRGMTSWPLALHLGLWMAFAILFPIWFYRYSRALWVVILHLQGDVFWDYEPYVTPTLSIADAFLKRPAAPDVEPNGSVPADSGEDDRRPHHQPG